MTKLEILRAMLSDPQIMESYAITQEQIDNIALSPYHSNNMIALIQYMVNISDTGDFTINTAAAKLNIFLENRLRDE